MTIEERSAAANRVFHALCDNGMGAASAQALAASLFEVPPDVPSFEPHTGVFGLWSPVVGAWLAKNDVLLHGPDCVMQAELRRIPDHLQGAFAVREFNVFGQPVLEPVEEMASSEA